MAAWFGRPDWGTTRLLLPLMEVGCPQVFCGVTKGGLQYICTRFNSTGEFFIFKWRSGH